ncbi:hypothetical protein [Burkholderia cepacia]|uniref:hypothetical protein n=1 Tax=Burkholderia cepacia TaxID=292 RepID=UPI000F5EFDD3|nr:hypothetical protein [Burkholderia cepacia]MCA8027445.1 hypothetical protein [Burkholderia cepacia]RRA21254.1 hypothetical protein DF038_21760 [Burkholderia cepacia]
MPTSLSSLQLPEGLGTIGNLAVEFVEDERKTYEMWMLETDLPFDEAVSRLSAFVKRHFGGDEQASSADRFGFRSWAASWSRERQEISTQLAGTDDGSSGYLRNAYDA